MKRLARRLPLFPLFLAAAYARVLERIHPELSFGWSDNLARANSNRTMNAARTTESGAVKMEILTPNAVCRFRARTFSTKEPETLDWIDEFGGSGAFYDIGANVGLYSIYYALRHDGMVYAFEPSVFNLGILARNIALNGVSDRVTIVPNPLTSANQIAPFHLTNTDEGGALSTFGKTVGPSGQEFAEVMHYDTIGFSLDFMVQNKLLGDPPTLMKIDVDGLEHFILRGAESTLRNPLLRTILIEVDDSHRVLTEDVSSFLWTAGFRFKYKKHASMFDSGAYSKSFNQIWTKG